jgi:ABC-type branched-subunit amino acid transport system permease subunit
MFKRSLILGIVSGLLAGIAGLLYAHLYYSINEADFSKVASSIRIIASSLAGGVLAAIGFTILNKWLKRNGEIVFNLLFSTISFASLLMPIAYKLPTSLETPELFPGMVIPMHFFPALAWFTLKPLFIRQPVA